MGHDENVHVAPPRDLARACAESLVVILRREVGGDAQLVVLEGGVREVALYSSTSDDQGRKSYKLLPETVHVPVGSLVQEVRLEWRLEGRTGGESHLSKESHVALVSHNFSNVV